MEYPKFIAVPHQLPPQEWFDGGEPLEDGDTYIQGDHDLHTIIRVDSWREIAELAASYSGHQIYKVRQLIIDIMAELI